MKYEMSVHDDPKIIIIWGQLTHKDPYNPSLNVYKGEQQFLLQVSDLTNCDSAIRSK